DLRREPLEGRKATLKVMLAKAGLAAGIHAGLTISVGKAGSVAHQPADGSELAHIINCWQRMPRRQLNNSVAVAKQHGIGPYENAIDTLLGEACEGRVDVALAARIHNPKF